MASVQRQPFGELATSRLQGLNAQKNCQNAISDALFKAPAPEKSKAALTSPAKRPYTPLFDDEDFDSENVDPASLSSKRSKAADGSFKSHFRLNTDFSNPVSKPFIGFGVGAGTPSSPASPLADKVSFAGLPTGASSAPAGRSPKHKRIGILSKKRTTASPIRRIDPPRFGAVKKPSAGLPFSIDAALSGTLSSYAAPAATSQPSGVKANDALPKSWFFDIHEDTPEEEAANLMEHSTCILDISSDDEAGQPKLSDDRGKENVPPPDHELQSTEGIQAESSPVKTRRSAHVDAMVDEGQERAPLGMLAAEEYFAHGLDAHSVAIVTADDDACGTSGVGADAELNRAPVEDVTENSKDGQALDADFTNEGKATMPVAVHEDESAQHLSV